VANAAEAGQGEPVEPPDRGRRWSLLLDLLAERGRLSVGEVVGALGVSEATVRRDFTALAREQIVNRVHGGVVATSVAYELPGRYRAGRQTGPRERIGAAAAQLVAPGAVIGINGGTTSTAAARALGARSDLAQSAQRPVLTVVTSAVNIAAELVLRPHIRTVVLGGVVKQQSYELTGPLAALVLEELWMETLLLGVDGVAATGVSCHHEGEAGINSLMVRRSDRVVVVAGSEKLGRRAFARICPLSAIHVLVTDSGADPDIVQQLRDAGIEVHLA
jgi:DeoR family transcriptional regulator of aga operon